MNHLLDMCFRRRNMKKLISILLLLVSGTVFVANKKVIYELNDQELAYLIVEKWFGK